MATSTWRGRFSEGERRKEAGWRAVDGGRGRGGGRDRGGVEEGGAGGDIGLKRYGADGEVGASA